MTPNERQPPAVFVTRDIDILEGDAARRALAEHNDSQYFDPERGITHVDQKRWEDAQSYERKTWMERLRNASDDRNRIHRAAFANYQVLRGRKFRRAIELGCGPFTNLRLILERTSVEEVHLLDPLIGEYLQHPRCRYAKERLGGLRWSGVLGLMRPLKGVPELLTSLRIGGLSGRPIHIERCSIEDFTTPHRFDLVVLINVIEHCQDAIGVFQKVDEILTPGGTFIFHDKFYDSQSLRESIHQVYDAGHPLRVDVTLVESFLSTFDALMRSELAATDVVAGVTLKRTSLFYIGQKKA